MGAGVIPFAASVDRLMLNGFVSIGYTDPHKRNRRLYANPVRVRDGKRNPWASVGVDGRVIYYQVDPRPAGYRAWPRKLAL